MTALMLLAALANAQTPATRWQTVETAHFRVHYPADSEAWGLEVAETLESIRARVNEEVGWVPPRTLDVVIEDPIGQANGSAWPFAGHPRMLLWATPPPPDSGIGHYRSWGELLLTHEYAHMVHLLRTSRNPFGKALEDVIGFAPITRKAPRWCIEGYATVVEARLSGFGRPNTDSRAQLLRRLAQGGSLPTYGGLNDFGRYQGGSFAYLVGSSYLEWLEARAGTGSLRNLWARMTARETRSFDEAFSGVFGDSPEVLYARFTAEVTAEAMAVEAARPVDPDTLWLDTSWYTGSPVVSLDGSAIAAVTNRPNKPSKLEIWSLGEPDQEALDKAEESRKKAMEEDPDDVLSVDPKHPPRKSLHSRQSRARPAYEPRWMPDGQAMLFTSWQPTRDGRQLPDLFLWEPETGKERRVTRGQNVRMGDPFPDGERALAVRQDWGRTHLVVVDLDTGDWEAMTEPSLGVVYDQPRVAPVGDRVAWLEHRGAGWAVVVQDAEGRAQWRIGGEPGGVIPQQLAWSPDGQSLYASIGADGFIEVHEVWGTNGARGQLTRSAGGAMAPTATADALFYLSMEPNGLEIHRLALDAVQPGVAVQSVAPVVRPEWEPGPEPPEHAEVEARPYGVGRTEWRPLTGGTWSRSQAAVEAGLRLGDIVGKRDMLLIGSYGRNTGITGGRLAFAYRGLPVEIDLSGFLAVEEPELMRRGGVQLSVEDRYRWSAAALSWTVGWSSDQPLNGTVEREGAARVEVPPQRGIGFIEVRGGWIEPKTAAVGVNLSGRVQAGATGEQMWNRLELGGGLGLGTGVRLRGQYTVGISDATGSLDRYRLGGVESSVLPDEWSWARIASPVFDLGSDRGANRDAVDVRFGQQGALELVAERHRMSDALGSLGRHGWTALSLQADLDTEALPFQRLPEGHFGAGLGCRVEDTLGGWAQRPCQSVDDYTLWVRAGWGL